MIEPANWIADTVTYCLDEALARFHAAGQRQSLTPAATRVSIATAPGLPQYLQVMLAARYSELYEVDDDEG